VRKGVIQLALLLACLGSAPAAAAPPTPSPAAAPQRPSAPQRILRFAAKRGLTYLAPQPGGLPPVERPALGLHSWGQDHHLIQIEARLEAEFGQTFNVVAHEIGHALTGSGAHLEEPACWLKTTHGPWDRRIDWPCQAELSAASLATPTAVFSVVFDLVGYPRIERAARAACAVWNEALGRTVFLP
jgi:hypothetical protein